MERICSVLSGLVVPIPTFPALSTINFVALDEPMTNDGAVPREAVGFMERRPHGLVEAMPTLLVVAPLAIVKATLLEKSVEEAMLNDLSVAL